MSFLSTLSPAGSHDRRRADPEIADQGRHRDVHDVVAEAAAVGPSARNGAVAEPGLDRAGQRVASEDAQTREPVVIRIARMVQSTAGQPGRARRQIDLDQIGNEDAGDVGPAHRGRHVRAEHERVDQRSELGIQRVLPEQLRIHFRRRAAVQVLVLERDQPFVEQRVALTRYLDEVSKFDVLPLVEDGDAPPAGRRIDADNLLVAADLLDRDIEHHRMDVESALRIDRAIR